MADSEKEFLFDSLRECGIVLWLYLLCRWKSIRLSTQVMMSMKVASEIREILDVQREEILIRGESFRVWHLEVKG